MAVLLAKFTWVHSLRRRIILLSTSIVALQEMLNICFHKGEELDIIFNNSKSCLFKIGPSYDCCIQNLKLGAADIV